MIEFRIQIMITIHDGNHDTTYDTIMKKPMILLLMKTKYDKQAHI